jgi:hypothetical protein
MTTSAEGDADTTRASVKVYVPAYQKDIWAEDAEELEMSQSEYVRTMVQAGRRGFEDSSAGVAERADPEAPPPDATPGVEGLETRVLDVLSDDATLDWEELVERLAGDFEERLGDVLGQLQQENRVRHSGPRGGYTLVSE